MRADAAAQEGRFPRWAAFAAVATLGFFVQAAVIVLLTGVGVHVTVATAAGVLAAIVHNFVLHEYWTWADRRGPAGGAGRFVRVIGSTGLVSLAGTVALTTWWVGLGTPAVLANLLAVLSVGLMNYLLLDRVIYRGER
jgi:putative flippase GtrA